jgi:hypothetical protein
MPRSAGHKDRYQPSIDLLPGQGSSGNAGPTDRIDKEK